MKRELRSYCWSSYLEVTHVIIDNHHQHLTWHVFDQEYDLQNNYHHPFYFYNEELSA